MAEVHWTRAASEQISAGNNHWSREQFYARAPDLETQRDIARGTADNMPAACIKVHAFD